MEHSGPDNGGGHIDGGKKVRLRARLLTAAGLWAIATVGLIAIFASTGSNDATAESPPIDVTTTTTADAHDHAPAQEAAGTELRRGVVHIHEDGTSHTHGAGAPEEWVVIYNSDGEFVPNKLEIITGDTVTWKNESDYGVWPASNIHPSHEIYPEFDPLKDIPPGGSWSFTFTRNGTWRYHNHSLASETGVVISSGGPEEALEPLSLDVDIPQFPDPPEGFDHVSILNDVEKLESFVETYGPDAAVESLRTAATLTNTYCHDIAHQAGRIAYQTFGVAAFLITPHECDSGAIHGVLEALFAERGTGSLEEDLKVVCAGMENAFYLDRCVHGVGHGIMAWTGYELHEALAMCDVLDHWQARSCHAGVFMENGVAGTTGLVGHSSSYVPSDDPHYPCNEVTQAHVLSCYDRQPTNLRIHMGYTTGELLEFCKELIGEIRRPCITHWSAGVAGELWPDIDRMVGVCEIGGLADSDRRQCVRAISIARLADVDDAIYMGQFCSGVEGSGILDASLGDHCWDGLFEMTPQALRGHSDRDGFCGSITDDDRRGQCTGHMFGG